MDTNSRLAQIRASCYKENNNAVSFPPMRLATVSSRYQTVLDSLRMLCLLLGLDGEWVRISVLGVSLPVNVLFSYRHLFIFLMGSCMLYYVVVYKCQT